MKGGETRKSFQSQNILALNSFGKFNLSRKGIKLPSAEVHHKELGLFRRKLIKQNAFEQKANIIDFD